MADQVGMAFIPYYKLLMELLETNEELNKTFTGILKMAGLTASGAVIGGFFGGKRGSAVGAAVATFFGCQTLDNYQSILAVLRNLNDEDKQQLVKRVQRLVGNITQDALRNYIRNSDQRTKLLTVIRDFAKDVNRDDNPSCDH